MLYSEWFFHVISSAHAVLCNSQLFIAATSRTKPNPLCHGPLTLTGKYSTIGLNCKQTCMLTLLESPLVNQLAPTWDDSEKTSSRIVVAPVNPHRQRLLAAEARGVKAKAKAKAKGKAKAKAKAKSKISNQFVKQSKDRGNEPHPTRSEYSEAKRNFFMMSLCLQTNNFRRYSLMFALLFLDPNPLQLYCSC